MLSRTFSQISEEGSQALPPLPGLAWHLGQCFHAQGNLCLYCLWAQISESKDPAFVFPRAWRSFIRQLGGQPSAPNHTVPRRPLMEKGWQFRPLVSSPVSYIPEVDHTGEKSCDDTGRESPTVPPLCSCLEVPQELAFPLPFSICSESLLPGGPNPLPLLLPSSPQLPHLLPGEKQTLPQGIPLSHL